MADNVMRALTEARDLAMKNTAAARIPECGDFGAIAQNLSWAIEALTRAAPPVGGDGLPPEDDRPERDWEKWIVGRGRLGPGAVPERIFFAGWLAGRRAAVPAQTGTQPAGDSVDSPMSWQKRLNAVDPTRRTKTADAAKDAEIAEWRAWANRRAAVSTASAPEARQIFEHKRIGDFTVQVTFRSARACGKFVEWVAAPSSPVEGA